MQHGLNTDTNGTGNIISTYLSTSKSSCYWTKCGKVVNVYFQITASAAIPNATAIINGLPKPIDTAFSAAVSNNGTNPVFAYGINTNGELYRNYAGPLTANETCYATISYISNE